jgi:hypothetical protein
MGIVCFEDLKMFRGKDIFGEHHQGSILKESERKKDK